MTLSENHVALVIKKDSSVCFCVDYRKLNKVTEYDYYLLLYTKDILDTLGSCQYFSTLDLRSGYWQVPVKEEDKKKTAFISYAGLYKYNIIPFGLINVPVTFQRLMDAVLAIANYTGHRCIKKRLWCHSYANSSR